MRTRSVLLIVLGLLACTSATAGTDAQENDLLDAADKGYLSRVQALLDAKADVNANDNNGNTAFKLAERLRSKDVVKFLKYASAHK